jgi:hypothetical protein
MKASCIHSGSIRTAITALHEAFGWGNSDEGFDYWNSVVKKLEGYLRIAEQSNDCKKEIAELRRRIEDLATRC